MSSPTPAEQIWLSYARRLLEDSEHLHSCALLGGSPDHPGVDATDLRWPGYLGARSMVGRGAVVMGNVHRNFASGAIGVVQRDRLVHVTRAWKAREVTDEHYLATVREVYLAGLRGWTVGKHIRYVLGVLGLELDQIAYLNAARCQYPEVPPVLPRASATKLALQRHCLQRFPVTALTQALLPQLVLFTSTSAYDVAAEADSPPAGQIWICMHQLNGTLARPVHHAALELPIGTRREVWATALAEDLGRTSGHRS